MTDHPPCRQPSAPPVGRAGNEPGRDQLDYRVGSHDRFLTAMVAALGAQPALAGLTSRASDEPVVAMLDAWATALDVLVFYQERIANEGFLRTATERSSVRALARGIGYELRPGVAATTWLAFEVAASPGTPSSFPIPAGTRVQSVPGPGELPQVFETVEALDARPEWNAMPIVASTPSAPAPGDRDLLLAGTDGALQPGDAVLIVAAGGSSWFDVRRVAEVDVVGAVLAAPLDTDPLVPAHTRVTLDAAIVAAPLGAALPGSEVSVYAMRQRASLFGYNAQDWAALPLATRIGELNPYFGAAAAATVLEQAMIIKQPAHGSGVIGNVLGSGSGNLVPRVLAGVYAARNSSWADAVLAANTKTIFLDQVYPRLIDGSWIVLERDGASSVGQVAAVAETPHSDFGMSARVSRVTFKLGNAAGFSPRNASVLVVSQRLPLALAPLPADVEQVNAVDLARPAAGLTAGRRVVLSGLGPDGQPASEVAVIKDASSAVAPSAGLRLLFESKLTGRYRRNTLKVLGNIAKATHGESRAEVLGSGDQRRAFQTFALRQTPLTYAPSSRPSGARSTLAVWVGGVRWKELASLHGARPDARVYIVRHADDGTVSVTFGDGQTGDRLPTGRENVVATYRVGIGTAADLEPGRISLPLSRPLGLRGVVNPVPAAGGDDPEKLERARGNAPLTVRTLGRIVSVADYADFARAFAGVTKARADVLWDGERQVIHLTVAGPGGATVDPKAESAIALRAAIDRARHPIVRVVVAGYAPERLVLAARLIVTGERRFPDVAAAARAALVERFSFERREFAQPVAQSEALAVLQGVPGVDAVLLGEFRAAVDPAGTRSEVVAALPAHRSGAATVPAALLTIGAADVVLEEAP